MVLQGVELLLEAVTVFKETFVGPSNSFEFSSIQSKVLFEVVVLHFTLSHIPLILN